MNRQEGYTGKGSLLDRVMRRVAYQWPVSMTNVHVPGGLITFTGTVDELVVSDTHTGTYLARSLGR